jgi:hypothetical protein
VGRGAGAAVTGLSSGADAGLGRGIALLLAQPASKIDPVITAIIRMAALSPSRSVRDMHGCGGGDNRDNEL